MNPLTLLLVILCIVLLLGGLPQVSGNLHNMGYGISGLGLVFVIILVVVLLRG